VHFQFDYAGLSFVAPQKVRYRYMLEGFDTTGPRPARARRLLHEYSAGAYTFRVQAANNDGVWNTAGAALNLSCGRTSIRRSGFTRCLLAGAGGTRWLVLKRRLYVAEREFKAVLGERSRIAREIHDTLAQGYVGISVQLEVLTELLRQRKVEDAVKQLDQTREYVREGLADARQSIWALRTQDAARPRCRCGCGAWRKRPAAVGSTAEFSFWGISSAARGNGAELLRVAQEAIHNVKKHAGEPTSGCPIGVRAGDDCAGSARRRTRRRIGATRRDSSLGTLD
jgi:signal transduction histidine kinase